MIRKYNNLNMFSVLFYSVVVVFFSLDKSNTRSRKNNSNDKEENDVKSRAVLSPPLL